MKKTKNTNQKIFDINNAAIDKIMISRKGFFVQKVLKALLVTKRMERLAHCIILPKISGSAKIFDETKYMSFLLWDNKLQKKYWKICDKVGISIKKEFDSEPVDDEKYLKLK